MSISIEKAGMEILKAWLAKNQRQYSPSDNKTYDLRVDGEYAELKAKGHGWEKFDFLSLSQNQIDALGADLKKIFVVLNVLNPELAKVVEIDAMDLLKCENRKIVHYEWNKGSITHLFQK